MTEPEAPHGTDEVAKEGDGHPDAAKSPPGVAAQDQSDPQEDAPEAEQGEQPPAKPRSDLSVALQAGFTILFWGVVLCIVFWASCGDELEVASAIQFNDDRIEVSGTVYKDSSLVDSGSVRLDVTDEISGQTASFQRPITGGRFQLVGGKELSWANADGALKVVTEATTPEGEEGSDTAAWGAAPRANPNLLWVVGVVVCWILIAAFAFTGPVDFRKHRTSLVIAYVIGFTFLAIPLVLPAFLAQDAGWMRTMARLPVSVLVVQNSGERRFDQWAVTVGGNAHGPVDPESSEPPKEGGAPPSEGSEPADTNDDEESLIESGGTGDADYSQDPVSNDTGDASLYEEPGGASVETEIDAAPDSAIEGAAGEQRPSGAAKGSAEGPAKAAAAVNEVKSYDVPGGIVVPLYVIILAMLGGAVSLVRQLP